MSYGVSHVATAVWNQCKSKGSEAEKTQISPKVVRGTVVADGVVGISSTTLGVLSLFLKSLTPLAPFAMPLIGVGSGILGSDALYKMLDGVCQVVRKKAKDGDIEENKDQPVQQVSPLTQTQLDPVEQSNA